MAVGTILTLLTGLIPLIPHIKSAIQTSEATVGAGNGERKKKLAAESVAPFARILKESGILPDDIDSPMIEDAIEAVFQLMKSRKELHESKKPEPFRKNTAYPVRIQGDGTIEFKVDPK